MAHRADDHTTPVPMQSFPQDPADIDAIAARGRRVETPCGLGSMVWRVWGEDAAKQPIVFLHGGSGSWTHWIRQIAAFAGTFEVWAPDMPGLGDSVMPDAPLTPATCGRVVAEGIYRLFSPERRPHVVCFSFGSHVGTFAAILLKDRIRSFTLSGSAALGLTHAHLDFGKEHSRMSAAERAEVHRANLAMLMIADPTRIDDLAVYCQSENIRRSRFRSRPFATTSEIRDTLPEVSVPVAAIWGARDQICIPDVESRHRVLRAAKPGLIWELIPDAGHWVMYEQPAAYNAALARVLAHV